MGHARLDLSVVVPVRNDAEGLTRLAASLLPLAAHLAEVIVVDDGSKPPIRAAVDTHLPLDGGVVRWLRTGVAAGAEGRGAGFARNRGAEIARGAHVLFLDADDTVTPDLAVLADELAVERFDMALFCHDDSRRLRRGETGPDEALDRAIWQHIAPRTALKPMTHDAALALCRMSNYPWNRIWRRDFLHEAGIRGTEIPMHNDIEPHWGGYLSAQRTLISGRRCVVHNVAPTGGRLTNRRDAQRLRMFEALDAVAARLQREALRDPLRAGFAGPFLDFLLRLGDWAEEMVAKAEVQAVFKTQMRDFLGKLAALDGPLGVAFDAALRDEPGLAERLLARIGS